MSGYGIRRCCCEDQTYTPAIITVATWNFYGQLRWRGVAGERSGISFDGVVVAMAINMDGNGCFMVYRTEGGDYASSYHNANGVLIWTRTSSETGWSSIPIAELFACNDTGVYYAENSATPTLYKYSLIDGTEEWTRDLTTTDWYAPASGWYIHQIDASHNDEIILFGKNVGGIHGIVYDADGAIVRYLDASGGTDVSIDTSPGGFSRMLYHSDGSYTYLENFGFFVTHYNSTWDLQWTLARNDPMAEGWAIWDPEGNGGGEFVAIAIANENDVYVSHRESVNGEFISAVVSKTDGSLIRELTNTETTGGQSYKQSIDGLFCVRSSLIGTDLVIGMSTYDDYGVDPTFSRTGNIGITSKDDTLSDQEPYGNTNFGSPPSEFVTVNFMYVDRFGQIWAASSAPTTTELWP